MPTISRSWETASRNASSQNCIWSQRVDLSLPKRPENSYISIHPDSWTDSEAAQCIVSNNSFLSQLYIATSANEYWSRKNTIAESLERYTRNQNTFEKVGPCRFWTGCCNSWNQTSTVVSKPSAQRWFTGPNTGGTLFALTRKLEYKKWQAYFSVEFNVKKWYYNYRWESYSVQKFENNVFVHWI